MCRRWRWPLLFPLLSVLGPPFPLRADEGRIPIFLSGSVLQAEGSYFLARNMFEPFPDLSTPAWVYVNNSNVDLDLNGMVLAPNTPGATLIQVAAGSDVRIHNGTLITSGTSILADNTRRLVLQDLRIRCSGGSSAPILLSDVANVVVRRVEISGCNGDQRGSIDIVGNLQSGVIEDNVIYQSGGIYVNSGKNLSISRNRIEGGGALSYAAIQIVSSSASRIVDNVIDAPEGMGVMFTVSDSSIVSGNVIRSSATHGLLFDQGSVSNSIAGNAVSLSGAPRTSGACLISDGLVVEGSRNFIRANSLTENCRYGLHLGYRNGDGSACANVLGENSANGNFGNGDPISGGCIGHPPLFPPDSCDSVGNAPGLAQPCDQTYPNSTFGDNRILPAY